MNSSVKELSGDVEEYARDNDNRIELLESDITDAVNEIDDVQKDFQSFTVTISQWQITVDERLDQTEDQIQDLNEIISGTTTTEPPTTTTRSSTPDECA